MLPAAMARAAGPPLKPAPVLTIERATRQEMPTRTFDVHHLKLELALDPEAGRISGEATLTLSPLSGSITEVPLHAADLAIEAAWIEREGTIDSAGTAVEPGLLRVALPRSAAPGETLRVRVRYTAHPATGLTFVAADPAGGRSLQIWSQGEAEENRFWYPAWDYPNDRATSELVVTVPEGLTAVGNGLLVARRENPDRTVTFHWREDHPHVNYLFSLAVGDFVRLPAQAGEVPLEVYVERGLEPLAERSFGHTADMVQTFARAFAHPYPFEKYAQVTVRDFAYWGMENVSATTLMERTLHDEAAHLTYTSDDLVAHELAHSWFGNMITCRSWSQLWLNEGFATYAEAIYYEARWGEEGLVDRLLNDRENYLEEYEEDYRRAIVTDVFVEPVDLLDAHTYSKAALVLHMLRKELGEEVFWTALHRYVAAFAWREVETSDLRRICEEVSGRDLGVFFDQWLYRSGHPVLAASWSWDRELGQVEIEIEQTQGVDDSPLFFDTALDIRIVTAVPDAGRPEVVDHRVRLRGARETFHFPAAARPSFVQLDPAGWLLAEIDFQKPAAEWALELASTTEVLGRVAAVRALGAFPGDTTALAALARALREDTSRHVRARAAASLGELGTESALDTLASGLADPDARVRLAVATALGEFASARAADRLLDLIDRDPSPYVVGAAAEALGATGDVRAHQRLLHLRQRSAHADEIARGAYAGLAALEDEAVLPDLMRGTGEDIPGEARRAAILGLGTLASELPERRPEIQARLVGLLDAPLLDTRLAAIEAMGESGDPGALPVLSQLGRSACGELVRATARHAAWHVAHAEDSAGKTADKED